MSIQGAEVAMSKQRLSTRTYVARCVVNANKKADVAEYQEAFDHVGLLSNSSPGQAEVHFI